MDSNTTLNPGKDYSLPGLKWHTGLRISISHLSISGMVVHGRCYLFFLFFFSFFFSICVFFHRHSRFTGQQEKGEHIYLPPLYYFHPFHRHLDISRGITANSSPLLLQRTHLYTSHRQQMDSNRKHLVSERKSLTTNKNQ